MVAEDLCSFTIFMDVLGPAASPGIKCRRSEHKSAGAVAVGSTAAIGCCVGNSNGDMVFVGIGVGGGVSVGGTGVAVGSAACVCAIMVNAPETAVP